MKSLREHLDAIARLIPDDQQDRRAAIYAFGHDVDRLLREIHGMIGALQESQRQLREQVDPLVYDAVELAMAGHALEMAEYYARMAGRADHAAADRAELWTMVRAVAADVATLRKELAQHAADTSAHARAVGALNDPTGEA